MRIMSVPVPTPVIFTGWSVSLKAVSSSARMQVAAPSDITQMSRSVSG